MKHRATSIEDHETLDAPALRQAASYRKALLSLADNGAIHLDGRNDLFWIGVQTMKRDSNTEMFLKPEIEPPPASETDRCKDTNARIVRKEVRKTIELGRV